MATPYLRAVPHAAPSMPASDTPLARFERIRQTTLALAAPLSDEDCQVQSMPDASPVKWHLAHTTWFFETFILVPFSQGYVPYSPIYKVLFNSYYNAVGDKHPRAARGMLSRPPLRDVLAYRTYVDEAMQALCRTAGRGNDDLNSLMEIGLNHEQQHQELILTDLKHMLSCNPLGPAYLDEAAAATMQRAFADLPAQRAPAAQPVQERNDRHASSDWTRFDAGVIEIGKSDTTTFGFDNESPRHRVYLQPYLLANRLVTQGEFLAFMQDGGYERPALWLSAGWDTVCSQGWRAPMYWEEIEGDWHVFTLHGMRKLDVDAPLAHVSFFEADAYARWAGARLPREAEWEHAAATVAPPDARQHNLLETGRFAPASSAHSEDGLTQMYGDVWEWTASSYDPYPGFSAPEGAVGEYNGKFMCNQYVLRGGSCITPQTHIRATYRNFFPTDARWQFSGIRLARDV